MNEKMHVFFTINIKKSWQSKFRDVIYETKIKVILTLTLAMQNICTELSNKELTSWESFNPFFFRGEKKTLQRKFKML